MLKKQHLALIFLQHTHKTQKNNYNLKDYLRRYQVKYFNPYYFLRYQFEGVVQENFQYLYWVLKTCDQFWLSLTEFKVLETLKA